MPEFEAEFERKLNPWSTRAMLTTFLCVIAANVFDDLGWLPYIGGFGLAMAIALVIEYWIPPKPPVSFPIWLLRILTLIVSGLLGLWFIPKFLSGWIWPPLAYGLPTLILFLSLRWIPPLYPVKRREALWKWVLTSFGAALLFACIGYYAPFE